MKKIVLIALVSCLSVQAEEVASSNGLKFYAGASAVGSWTSSDFKMDYEVNKVDFSNAEPYAKHKENSIGRVGAGFAAGIKKKFSNNWFVGGELGYTLSRAKHHHDFVGTEDVETDQVFRNHENDVISRVNVRHGDEWGLSLKFGKDCCSYNVYGILGVTTKNIEIEYSVDADTHWVNRDDGFDVSEKKRAWGAVFGLGGSKKINNRISCSLEYRYKVYNSAKKSVDCRAEAEKAFVYPHDTSDRNFKVKSDKHELSLGVTFNI